MEERHAIIWNAYLLKGQHLIQNGMNTTDWGYCFDE